MAFKVDSADASVTEPSRGAAGTLKFFSDALRTTVSGWWLNMVQNEVCSAVTKFGLTLDKSNDNQLGLAIQAGIDASIAVSEAANPFINYALFKDEKASGVNGQTPTPVTFVKRNLTEIINTISGVSIASDVITLPAGTYRIKGYGIAGRNFGVTGSVSGYKTQSGIFDGDSGSVGDILIAGSIGMNGGDDFSGHSYSNVDGQTTLVSSSTITFRQWTSTTAGTILFGIAANTGLDEVYAAIEIWKLS